MTYVVVFMLFVASVVFAAFVLIWMIMAGGWNPEEKDDTDNSFDNNNHRNMGS